MRSCRPVESRGVKNRAAQRMQLASQLDQTRDRTKDRIEDRTGGPGTSDRTVDRRWTGQGPDRGSGQRIGKRTGRKSGHRSGSGAMHHERGSGHQPADRRPIARILLQRGLGAWVLLRSSLRSASSARCLPTPAPNLKLAHCCFAWLGFEPGRWRVKE